MSALEGGMGGRTAGIATLFQSLFADGFRGQEAFHGVIIRDSF